MKREIFITVGLLMFLGGCEEQFNSKDNQEIIESVRTLNDRLEVKNRKNEIKKLDYKTVPRIEFLNKGELETKNSKSVKLLKDRKREKVLKIGENSEVTLDSPNGYISTEKNGIYKVKNKKGEITVSSVDGILDGDMVYREGDEDRWWATFKGGVAELYNESFGFFNEGERYQEGMEKEYKKTGYYVLNFKDKKFYFGKDKHQVSEQLVEVNILGYNTKDISNDLAEIFGEKGEIVTIKGSCEEGIWVLKGLLIHSNIPSKSSLVKNIDGKKLVTTTKYIVGTLYKESGSQKVVVKVPSTLNIVEEECSILNSSADIERFFNGNNTSIGKEIVAIQVKDGEYEYFSKDELKNMAREYLD